jgi:hypothetical protein
MSTSFAIENLTFLEMNLPIIKVKKVIEIGKNGVLNNEFITFSPFFS